MKRSGSISGGISLVMIFCVLCMTVFAALTMVTAQREHDMARLTAQRAEEANEADRIAAETVAALARGEGHTKKQAEQAFRAGLNFKGKPMHFDLRYSIGLPVTPDECYRSVYDGPHCHACGSRLICNGCSHCGKCG